MPAEYELASTMEKDGSEVAQKELLSWMKYGCIDKDTCVVLRVCLLKKRNQDYRRESSVARKMLSQVRPECAKLLAEIILKEISDGTHSTVQAPIAANSLSHANREIKDGDQAALGFVFGLILGAAFCRFLLKKTPEKKIKIIPFMAYCISKIWTALTPFQIHKNIIR